MDSPQSSAAPRLSKQASLVSASKFWGPDALTRNVVGEGGRALPEKQHKIYNALAMACVNHNSAIDTSRSAWISLASLRTFVTTQQLEPCDDADAARIIAEHEPDHGMRARQQLSYEGFARFLLDARNFAFVPETSAPTQEELSYPLSYYYIASSHNTYLTGHQLKGDSSAELYRQVLMSGCRCVELDCWDGDNGHPVIYHGHTFTTKISFRRAIEIIKRSAFLTSSLPVILSIENHCSIQQQTIMAQMFKNVFGEELVSSFLFETDFSNNPHLPSPLQLQRRIIIKYKKLVAHPAPPLAAIATAPSSIETAPTHAPTPVEKLKLSETGPEALTRKLSKNSFTSSNDDEDDEDESEDELDDLTEDLYSSNERPAGDDPAAPPSSNESAPSTARQGSISSEDKNERDTPKSRKNRMLPGKLNIRTGPTFARQDSAQTSTEDEATRNALSPAILSTTSAPAYSEDRRHQAAATKKGGVGIAERALGSGDLLPGSQVQELSGDVDGAYDGDGDGIGWRLGRAAGVAECAE